MGKKIMPKGRPFQPGVSGNPSGMPKQDPKIKAFRETTYKDFLAGLQKYGSMHPDEIEADLKRPETTAFEAIFGSIVLGATKGEKDARQVLLDRLWGKVKDSIEIGPMVSDVELDHIGEEKIAKLLREVGR